MRALLRRMSERLANTSSSLQPAKAGNNGTALAAAEIIDSSRRGNAAHMVYGGKVVQVDGMVMSNERAYGRANKVAFQPVMRQL